ncbi:MAG: metallophosphoesterase family protein [Afipia felis]|nr:metallophosphoesterase family protein [Afipia felis]
MRIHLVSDLHTDIRGNGAFTPPAVDCDVIVVAGDAMAPGVMALRKVRELYPDRDVPVIYVPGNHDFYSEGDKKLRALNPALQTTYERQRIEMPAVAAGLGIILLDNSVAEIDGVRFVGSTLWSDFSARPGYVSFADAVREAMRGHNDYKFIKVGQGRSKDKIRPGDTISEHKVARSFIEATLAEPFDGETVVITHHSPSYRSLRGEGIQFGDLDWVYASNLEQLMTGENAPTLWMHGHIHTNRDYVVGNTRIIANPRGYPASNNERENPDFDPSFLIEIEPKPVPGMRI